MSRVDQDFPHPVQVIPGENEAAEDEEQVDALRTGVEHRRHRAAESRRRLGEQGAEMEEDDPEGGDDAQAGQGSDLSGAHTTHFVKISIGFQAATSAKGGRPAFKGPAEPATGRRLPAPVPPQRPATPRVVLSNRRDAQVFSRNCQSNIWTPAVGAGP